MYTKHVKLNYLHSDVLISYYHHNNKWTRIFFFEKENEISMKIESCMKFWILKLNEFNLESLIRHRKLKCYSEE